MIENINKDKLEEAILKSDHVKCEEILKKIAEEEGGKNLSLVEEKILQILNNKYFPTSKLENFPFTAWRHLKLYGLILRMFFRK